jgi:zinc protease
VTAARTVEAEMDKTQAVLMVGFLGTDMFSPDRTALELIDEASSDLGSRFFIRIREQMGLAYFVGSSHMMGLVPSPFVFYLGTDPAKLTAVQAELMSEIKELATDGLTDVELARAKEKLLGQQEIRNQSNDSFAFASGLDELYGRPSPRSGGRHCRRSAPRGAEVFSPSAGDHRHRATGRKSGGLRACAPPRACARGRVFRIRR